MIIDKKTKEPYINIWFGNFYRPAYDDKEAVKEGIALLKRLGFNSVMLDTKAWEDFKERCEGKEASQFVSMHEYMQRELEHMGMSHEFLALYMNGDNLYPNIRFSPPIYGESVVDKDGKDGKWYRYWSDAAKDSMEAHVRRLMEAYGNNYVTVLYDGTERKPICSMWDPIVAPSFDEEGRKRYISWLSAKYRGNIDLFNQAYGLSRSGFDALEKEDYWFPCRYPDSLTYSEEDIREQSPKARMLMDNRKWQCDELCLYFKDMKDRLHRVDGSLYLCPDLAQWGYFLNVNSAMLEGVGFADLWDTAARGIDLYRLSEYVDCAHFISVPVTPSGDADAYVTSCHHSMMRCMNTGREFLGGIYWGRYLYNDIYRVLTPEEIVGSIVAGGASGYTSYGLYGLDDGGVLHRMEERFHDSLQRANEWAKQVIPQLGMKKKVEIGILFPAEMAAFETMGTEGNAERRLDLLGWYKACRDLDMEADVVHMENLCRDHLIEGYKVLILPDNDCYEMNPCPEWEEILRTWCENGGILLYGPDNQLAKNTFGIHADEHPADAICYRESLMVKSRKFCTYPGGTGIASYLSDGAPCVTRYQTGKGWQFAFGFSYGYAYDTKSVPHVPVEQKNNELYPLEMAKENMLAEILRDTGNMELKLHRGIETAYFENGEIVVNHTSYPYEVRREGDKLYQYRVSETLLLPHSAVFIRASF